MDHRIRIVAAVILATLAVLESLASQGILDPQIASIVTQCAIILLPALGLGAAADAIAVERRRRDPSIPALRDDIQHIDGFDPEADS
jgi:hypothetical protein